MFQESAKLLSKQLFHFVLLPAMCDKSTCTTYSSEPDIVKHFYLAIPFNS